MNPPAVQIGSDASAAWRFGHFFTPLVAVLVGTLSPLIASADGISVAGYVGIEVFAVLIGLLLGYGYSWYSYAWYRDVSYVVDGGFLRVRRNGVLVREIPVEAILGFRTRYVVDRRSVLVQIYPPSWPRGVVTYQDGDKRKRIELTPLLLWGADATRAAEQELRSALFEGSDQ